MNQSSAGGVALQDVLRLVLPLNTIILGGEYADRAATWVSILTELGHFSDQIKAGDVVIFPASLQDEAGDRGLLVAIPEIAALSASALLTFRMVSQEVGQVASELALPILVVIGQAGLREIHQGIAGLLVDRQKQIAERGLQLYRRLTEMSREGQGLDAMTDVMSRLTGKIVAVQDKRLDIIALAIPEGSELPQNVVRATLMARDQLPRILRNRKAVANTSQSHWQQPISIGDIKVARLISPIISGDRARGYVSVVGRPDELDLLDTLTVDYGAAACALEMAKVKAISEAKKGLRGDFLEGLLAGRLPEPEIDRLSGRLDHETNYPHAIMTFSWAGENTPSMRRLESPLNWLLSSHKRPALTHIYSNDHVCVFQALTDEDEDLSSALELARRLREHLRAEFPEVRLVAGISGPAESLAQWPEVYRQAVQAMELARRLGLDSTVEYQRLGVYELLTKLENLASVRQFYGKIIGPLADYDQRHRSSLIQTLEAYFNHLGNISQTAERLFIHRNTLLYRLERIQELTGQNMDHADERLALQLALKLWQLHADPKL